MRFCASKTPARRKPTVTSASNCDWRGLVVCGTRVTSARSVSAAGTLMTRAGRTLAVIPRSTSHTSPRRGLATTLLATIQVSEKTVGGRDEVLVVGKIVRRLGHASRKLRDDFGSIALGQRFEFFDQFLRRLRHETRVPRCVLEVKLSLPRPNAKFQPRRPMITPAAAGCKPCWAARSETPSPSCPDGPGDGSTASVGASRPPSSPGCAAGKAHGVTTVGCLVSVAAPFRTTTTVAAIQRPTTSSPPVSKGG